MENLNVAFVSVGGGGDNPLAAALASYSKYNDGTNNIVLAAINSIKSYKDWLITENFNDITRKNCSDRKD